MASKAVTVCSKMLAIHKLTIAFAESATAGRLSAEFAMTPQSGTILKGGLVCYDACIKEDILKVPHKLITKYTPESAEVTEELAKRLKKFITADIHVAVTGLTTPGGSETPEKPVGTIFIHILVKNRSVGIREVFKGTAEKIVLTAIDRIAHLIVAELGDMGFGGKSGSRKVGKTGSRKVGKSGSREVGRSGSLRRVEWGGAHEPMNY